MPFSGLAAPSQNMAPGIVSRNEPKSSLKAGITLAHGLPAHNINKKVSM